MIEPTRIYAEDALRLLQEVVREKGIEYKYIRRTASGEHWKSALCVDGYCLNWVKDESGARVPDCIMGHVYDKLGVLGVVGHATDVYGNVRVLAASGVEMTRRALYLFGLAQTTQDMGRTWGEALNYVTRALNTVGEDDTEVITWERAAEMSPRSTAVASDPWNGPTTNGSA